MSAVSGAIVGPAPCFRAVGASGTGLSRAGSPAETYNEAFVFDGERMIPATLVDAPWLQPLQPNGEGVSLILRTLTGRTAYRR